MRLLEERDHHVGARHLLEEVGARAGRCRAHEGEEQRPQVERHARRRKYVRGSRPVSAVGLSAMVPSGGRSGRDLPCPSSCDRSGGARSAGTGKDPDSSGDGRTPTERRASIAVGRSLANLGVLPPMSRIRRPSRFRRRNAPVAEWGGMGEGASAPDVGGGGLAGARRAARGVAAPRSARAFGTRFDRWTPSTVRRAFSMAMVPFQRSRLVPVRRGPCPSSWLSLVAPVLVTTGSPWASRAAAAAEPPAPAPAAPAAAPAAPAAAARRSSRRPLPPRRLRRSPSPRRGGSQEPDGTSIYFYRTNFVKPADLVETMKNLLTIPGRHAQGLPAPEPGARPGHPRGHRDRARRLRLLRHRRPAGLRRGEDHRDHLREQLRVRLLVPDGPRRPGPEHVLPRRRRHAQPAVLLPVAAAGQPALPGDERRRSGSSGRWPRSSAPST